MILSSVLSLIAALHLYWAVRGVGTGAGVPSRADGTPVMRPGRLSALAVAAALVTASLLLLGQASVIRTGLPAVVLSVGSWGVAATFAARTIGEFRYVGLFRRVRGTPFAKWDALVFTPLCFVLAVGAAAIAATRTSQGDVPRDAESAAVAVVDTGRVAIEGGTLFWEAAGSGAPVVLIHGGNLDRRMWDAQFEALRHDYRVIRYDARGFGRSSPADRPFRASDDLASLLRAHRIERATLVGLSMGGGIAIDLALAYPDMVRRLVLAAPSVRGGEWPPDADTLWLAGGRAAFSRGDSIGLALAWLESEYIRTALSSPAQAARIREIVTDNAGHLMRRARDQELEREQSPPVDERLGELRMPVLLLIGGADTPPLRAMALAVAERAPRAERIDLPGVGHMINLEAPAAFNRAVLAFLARP